MRVELHQIVKRFGTLVANNCVDFSVGEGELHCLLGENGAGKTTLVNVLYGVYEPDEGDIFVDGRRVVFKCPKDAIAQGIGMISQHFNLVSSMTVTENIIIGRIPTSKPFAAFWDKNKAKSEVLKLMESTGLRIEPDRLVSELTVGERQRVEILKALYLGSELLVLDEPTAVLSPIEIEELFDMLRTMTAKGKSIIIITHKLSEAMRCDHITVLKRGIVCFTASISAIADHAALKDAMFGSDTWVGRDTVEIKEPNPDTCVSGQCVLTVEGLEVTGSTRASTLKEVTFDVRAGEIFGIAGVAGNGQVELLNAIAGLAPALRGRIYLDDRDITDLNPKNRRRLGLRCIPEDRKVLGALLDLCIWENLILGFEDAAPFSRGRLLNNRHIGRYSDERMKKFNIKASDRHVKVRNLSGGNLQKVILARELGGDPRLIVAAQPTRGLDIRTSDFVREQLLEQKQRGAAVILISYDLDEIMALADRIGVIFEGRLEEHALGEETIESIGKAMIAGWA